MIVKQGELRAEIYAAAVAELEELQREMSFEQVSLRKRQRRTHALVAGGILLSSLMSALTAQAYLPPFNRPLSAAEAEAVSNLVDYVAARTGAERAWLVKVVCVQLETESLNDLRASQYSEVIDYLLQLAK